LLIAPFLAGALADHAATKAARTAGSRHRNPAISSRYVCLGGTARAYEWRPHAHGARLLISLKVPVQETSQTLMFTQIITSQVICNVLGKYSGMLVDNKDYPEIAADFARTFQILRALPCDVFLGAHGGYYGMIQKFEKSKSGTAKNPFIDPEGYRAYVELKEKAFRDTLTAQQTTKAPNS
jgi:hypothetical protein